MEMATMARRGDKWRDFACDYTATANHPSRLPSIGYWPWTLAYIAIITQRLLPTGISP